MNAPGHRAGNINGITVTFWPRHLNLVSRRPVLGAVSPGNRRFVLSVGPKAGRNQPAATRKGGPYGESRLKAVPQPQASASLKAQPSN